MYSQRSYLRGDAERLPQTDQYESELYPKVRSKLLALMTFSYVGRWLSPSPVNTSAWVALVDAELASIANDPDAFKLYDIAVKSVAPR